MVQKVAVHIVASHVVVVHTVVVHTVALWCIMSLVHVVVEPKYWKPRLLELYYIFYRLISKVDRGLLVETVHTTTKHIHFFTHQKYLFQHQKQVCPGFSSAKTASVSKISQSHVSTKTIMTQKSFRYTKFVTKNVNMVTKNTEIHENNYDTNKSFRYTKRIITTNTKIVTKTLKSSVLNKYCDSP